MASLYKYGKPEPFFKTGENSNITEPYQNAIKDCVNRFRQLDSRGKCVFLHITDTHSMGAWTNEFSNGYASMLEVATQIGADFVVHTGDAITGGSPTTATGWQNALTGIYETFNGKDIPLIVSRGNHDDNSTGSNVGNAESVITNNWWNWRMSYADNRFTIPENSNGYFYYDIPGKNIRVVNVNASDLTEEERLTVGGQNYMIVSDTQLLWLDNVALNTDRDIICVCHGNAHTYSPNAGIQNRTAIYNVLKKHNTVRAWMFGHNHMNSYIKDTETGIVFSSACAGGGRVTSWLYAGYGTSQASAAAKEASPTGSFIFDVCVLNHDNSITKVRWGAQDDQFGD